jgi:hypothetical protein
MTVSGHSLTRAPRAVLASHSSGKVLVVESRNCHRA